MTTINNALPATHLGTIPSNRNAVFYRVETWKGGIFVADFALKAQADEFAANDVQRDIIHRLDDIAALLEILAYIFKGKKSRFILFRCHVSLL